MAQFVYNPKKIHIRWDDPESKFNGAEVVMRGDMPLHRFNEMKAIPLDVDLANFMQEHAFVDWNLYDKQGEKLAWLDMPPALFRELYSRYLAALNGLPDPLSRNSDDSDD